MKIVAVTNGGLTISQHFGRATHYAVLTMGLIILLVAQCTVRPEPGTELVLTRVATANRRAEDMKVTIVYDNNAYDPRLRTAWGFACWVQRGDSNVLFDTGGDASTLLGNMSALGFDPQDIDAIVLSHIHGDHTGGLRGLLATGIRPPVYVPASFPERFKAQLRELVPVHEVSEAQEILPGIYSTGEMGTGIREQSLIVRTDQGLVLITGCAHPGIVEIVRRAKSLLGGEIYLVIGGFHLGSASISTIRNICIAFRQLGVRKLAPCHCTGAQAMHIFAAEFGNAYLHCGVGRSIDLGSGPRQMDDDG